MKLQIKNIDRREIILHSIFWICWIISFTIIQSLGNEKQEYFVWFMYYLITLPVFIVHTYIIAYYLLPQTFFKGRYLFFVFGILLLLVLFSVIELIISNELVFKPFDPEKAFSPGYLNLKNIVISGVGNHYIILVFLAIKAGRSWYSANMIKEELAQTKMETELEIFRYQLQPKVILTLMEELEVIGQENGDKSPEMLINISNFLNQFLFEGREELIPLPLEVQLIKEFLKIHDSSVPNRLKSTLVANGSLKSYVIPPLLLLPFLNYAIKQVYRCNNSFEISVIIKAEKKYLLLSFSFWSDRKFRITDTENKTIIQKRLNYKFPGKYRLIENLDDNFWEISLEIFS